MATNLDDSVLVKILFDKEKNQVICAEAGGDFIDILFSFLTLPMGTVVRLIQRQKFPDSAQIGCFSNLYHSVKGLSAHLFNTDPCKDLLTYPKNSLEPVCKDIKVKVDDISVRYFLCADLACRKTISYYKNAICSCGKLLNSEAFESKAKEEGNVVKELNPKDTVEVFVKRSTTYLVTDDMKVTCCTPGNLVEVFLERGIKNVNLVEENVLKLGPEEMLNLLGNILISKTPLTDLFLLNQKVNFKNISGKEADCHVTSNAQSVNASQNIMEVKLFVSKSNMKPLYVEAMEDFVELLLNFLRFPLSNVVRLFTGDSSLGCVDNLYKSVAGLHAKWFVKEGSKLFLKVLLLSPGIAPKFDCSIKDSIFSGVNWREIDRMSISKMGEICRVNIYSDDHVGILVYKTKTGFVQFYGLVWSG